MLSWLTLVRSLYKFVIAYWLLGWLMAAVSLSIASAMANNASTSVRAWSLALWGTGCWTLGADRERRILSRFTMFALVGFQGFDEGCPDSGGCCDVTVQPLS
jgi:hypothetical protein